MIWQAALIAILSAGLLGALFLMSDRKRGAFLAQVGLPVVAGILFVAIVVDGSVVGIGQPGLAAFAIGLISVAVAGMLYHRYLGRFARVGAARGVFSAVYLALSAPSASSPFP
jgi:hypothetical protein